MKKHLKWIIPVAILVVLLAAAAVSLLLFGKADAPQAESQERILVCWNVDRDEYWDETNKVSLRMQGREYYRVRVAVGGEQIDLFVDNYEVMNRIDSQKFMGLRVNEENVVTEVLKFYEFTGGMAVYEYYVVDLQEDLVVCNNLANGRGLPLKLKINENTEIYDVGGEGLLVGLPGVLEIGSRVYGVMGKDGYASHLYVMPPFQPEPVYWNVNRLYNSTAKVTTRERDAAGYFVYDFILDSEQLTLRTRSVDVATKIDAFGAKCMHLEFDEEGLISDAIHAKYSTGGNTVASWYHVLRIDSADDPANIEVVTDGFYAEKFSGSDKGNTAECTLAENVKIYDMSGMGAYLGQPTELRLYDQVHCLTDPFGDVCLIFVISRPVEADLYYNLERKWDAKSGTSTRIPGAGGYYYFKMSVNGKTVTLKTKDTDIVKTIDGRAAKVLGLTLDGDVITGAYVPSKVSGSNETAFDYCDVTQILEDGTVIAQRNGNTFEGKVTSETQVYNVSGTATVKGESTNIRVGDKLYGFRDFAGNVTTVYVVSRQVPGPVYWNLDRDYDSTAKVSRRKCAEDGYYYIKLFDGTKTVTFKTKSKAMVNKLDSFVAVALSRNGDVIVNCYKYDQVKGYTGGGFASWQKVTAVNGMNVTAGGVTGTMVYGCPIYDVSQGSKQPVTRTSLKVGDRIHGIYNANKQIVAIYVVGRILDCELYYNVDRKWNPDGGITDRVPDEDGFYHFTMSCNGETVALKTDSLDVANTIDSRAAKVLGLKLDGDVILAAFAPASVDRAQNTTFDYTVVTQIAEDGTITATRNGKTFTGKPHENCKVFNVSSSAAVPGEVTTVQVGDTVYGLSNGAKKLTYVYVVSRTVEAATKTAHCDVCDAEVEWSSWDGTSQLTDGHWYLNTNIKVSKTINILGDHTVCLDLCGFSANGAETLDRIFNIYGVFNLMDSGETGKVIANYANETGRTGSVFYIQNSSSNGYGVFNLYSGTLTSNGVTKQGGIGGIANDFYMYGGAIVGGNASVNGGSLYVENTNDATVTLLGGTITGGSAGGVGKDIFTNRSITVGGDVQIGDIYLAGNAVMNVQDLEGAAIGFTLANGYGVIAKGAEEADLNCFTDSAGQQILYQEGTLVIPPPVVPHEDHCICGGHADGVGDHSCSEPVTWEPWSGSFVSGGYYYLVDDVVLSAEIRIELDQTLNLCLNGHTISTNETTDRAFNIFGTLNLCDHKQDGGFEGNVIGNYSGTSSTRTGRVFYVQNKATFHLYGGNLISRSATAKGAVGGIAKNFTMYDGTISGGIATVSGGNLQVDAGTVTIYGGQITGGKSASGGNIYMNRGVLRVLGGQITGGEAETSGGGIYLHASAADATVGGSARITDNIGSNLYLSTGRAITLSETVALTSDALIGVTLEAHTGVFCHSGTEADLASFRSDAGKELACEEGALILVAEPEIPEQPQAHTDHCICGGLGEVGDHSCQTDLPVWEAWDGTQTSGTYYLQEDMTLEAEIIIAEGETLNLCLNGKTLTGGAEVNRMFNINGILNLCDHADEHGDYAGVAISKFTGTTTRASGRVFYVQNKTDAAFCLFGGTLLSEATATNGSIGGVSRGFRMYAGTISGANATENGGNLILESNTTQAYLYGGTITAGTAKNGGNIYIKGAATLTVDGATLSGGLNGTEKNATNGGNIYVEKGTLNLVSGTVSGGYAVNAGGNIRVQGDGVLNISGGLLTAGRANGNGGNVYSIGRIQITGGTVCNGRAATGKIGGNLYASAGSLSIFDDLTLPGQPTITGGTATTGGNIAIKTDAAISDCLISDGTATTGPEIYFEKADGVLTLAGMLETTVYVKSGEVDTSMLEETANVTVQQP